MSKEEEDKRNTNNPFQQPNRGYQGKEEEEEMRLFGVLMFGLIGATATTLAVTKFRRTVDWVYSQLSRSRSSWNGSNGGSFRTSFQEEAWRRYNRRMREEYEEEMERVERIRRMQSVFNRERNKHQRKYESWAEHGSGAYHQHFQRNDWYWKADTSHRDRADNFRETGHNNAIAPLSHHYSILGLDRMRTKPYTDNEIKSAFREKAKKLHPDQNQNNKEVAEAKFKEVLVSYEAIKSERKNNRKQ
ncbi:dnaJ homolog subfamily C member 7 homolog isoform X1 [Olea europaea subsp. europaea]|uniref:DnaJ homolog subfamily C member 7 homolog isoform X1 n=2 Tax=Olea europaea subsp. europaea TaxID=158383 RepID=A0A8S0TIS2_OLEEU|nr:dnaJ homolog subfamily C member 7 homolog isoform X1 [Olea europaea subsp. europaea]